MYKPGEIFTVIDEMASGEVFVGGKPYSNTISLTNVNKKVKDSDIIGLDTFRGCSYKCLSCYANKMSKISQKDFINPIPLTKFSGKIHTDKIYRFGTVGDPDVDWEHTGFAVKTMINKGLKRYFFITKLQNVDYIDPEIIKDLQVSVDPLNKRHFFNTLRNLKKISKNVSGIVIRLRMVRTENRDINRLINTAISFSEKYKIPILETKMKFARKDYLNRLQLVGYDRIHGSYTVRGSILRERMPKVLSCDEFNKGTCKGCKICPDMAGGVDE